MLIDPSMLHMVAPEIFGSCSGTKRPPSAAYPANPLGIQDPKQLQHYLVMLYRYIYVQNYVATIDLFNSLYFKQIWHALNDIEPLYFTHTWVSRFLLWFHWEHLMLSVTLSSFTQISINVLKKKNITNNIKSTMIFILVKWHLHHLLPTSPPWWIKTILPSPITQLSIILCHSSPEPLDNASAKLTPLVKPLRVL